MKNIFVKFICIVALLLITGCEGKCKRECDSDGRHCKKDCGEGGRECVSADDWGYPKVFVPADTETIVKELGGFIDKDDMYRVVGTKESYAPWYDEYFEAKDDYIVNAASANGAVQGAYPDQTVLPIDSGQILIDANSVALVMTVNKTDKWTSWFGGEVNYSPTQPEGDITAYDAGKSVINRECKYKVTENNAPSEAAAPTALVFTYGGPNEGMAPSVLWKDNDDTSYIFYINSDFEYRELNGIDPNNAAQGPSAGGGLYTNGYTPCYFYDGMGLYVGFAPNLGITPPTFRDIVETYHIPDSKRPGTVTDNSVEVPDVQFEGQSLIHQAESNKKNAYNTARGMDGYLIRGLVADEFINVNTRDQLFFKIVDRYYNDNEGSYTVKIKEGTRNPNDGPIKKVVDFFVGPIITIMERMYEGIVTNRAFINIVRALLILMVAIYGFKLIVFRSTQEHIRKDAVIRMFKIGIIATLISPESWDFFVNHLFGAFLVGIEEVASLLLNPFGDYDPRDPWYSMDQVLAKLFSGETSAKISSTLFSNVPIGAVYIIFLYLGIIMFLLAVVKAVIVYVIAFLAIALLIALAPIFFIFMLFDKTVHLVKEWWNQLVAFSIQQLLLMAALGMFAQIIIMYLEKTVGYRVCWNVYADFDFLGVNKAISYDFHLFSLKFWMPDISSHMTNIWMDVDGNGVRDPGGPGRMPEMAFRYEDLPYFDPVHDKQKIAEYLTEKNFLQISDVLVFILSIILMVAFMDFIPQMSEALKGGSPADTSSVFGAAKGLHFAIVSGLKETASSLKAWDIGGSKNTKSLMDNTISYWDSQYSTRGGKGLQQIGMNKIARKSAFDWKKPGGIGIGQRLRSGTKDDAKSVDDSIRKSRMKNPFGRSEDSIIKKHKADSLQGKTMMDRNEEMLMNAKGGKSALDKDMEKRKAGIIEDKGDPDTRKGVGGLRDGTGGLRDGTGGLRDGTGDLRDGTGGLRDGTGGLRDDNSEEVGATRQISTKEKAISKADELLNRLGFADGAIDKKNLDIAQRREALEFVNSSDFNLISFSKRYALFSALSDKEKGEAEIPNELRDKINSISSEGKKAVREALVLYAKGGSTDDAAIARAEAKVDSIFKAELLLRKLGGLDKSGEYNDVLEFINSDDFDDLPNGVKDKLVNALPKEMLKKTKIGTIGRTESDSDEDVRKKEIISQEKKKAKQNKDKSKSGGLGLGGIFGQEDSSVDAAQRVSEKLAKQAEQQKRSEQERKERERLRKERLKKEEKEEEERKAREEEEKMEKEKEEERKKRDEDENKE
jgi:type IV secretory pathway VirB6-like protein